MNISTDLKVGAIMVSVGILIGLAKILASAEKVTWKIMLGRVVLSGFTGLAAAAFVVFIPGISVLGQIGLACILSQIGVAALEKLLVNFVK